MASGITVQSIDNAIASFFAAGNGFTIGLAGFLVVVLLWPILTGQDPDIHPFLLARQAQTSPVRQPRESGAYRANEIPYGFPLRRGLGVKDPGAPAWSQGRDGDLRDIWKKAVSGEVNDKGVATGKKGKFLTIMGREKVVEQKFDNVTKDINAVGLFIRKNGGKTVAISLSNSVELLSSIFASAFYGFTLVLVPYGLEQSELQSLLAKASPDFLITEAASIELDSALPKVPSLKNIIYVVKEGSRHIDWTDKPAGVIPVKLFQWHDIAQESSGSSEFLASEKDSKTGPIVTFCKTKSGQYELVEYPSETIIAGTGGLLSTLLRQQKITSKDVLLSTASLTDTYALCWTLAALYSNATIALNSVAGDSVDLTVALAGFSPTLIVTSSSTISKYHEMIAASSTGISRFISNYFQKRSMKAGILSARKPAGTLPNLSALRILLISQRDTETAGVPSSVLAGLRVALGCRTAYALTSRSVAGAVAQTNIFDYRDKGTTVSVGPPVTSLELYVTGTDEMMDRDTPEGKIAVRGPAVIGGKAQLDVTARIDLDRTVRLLWDY